MTLSLGKRCEIWKVRAIPIAVRRWLGQRVTSRPNSSTRPDEAGRMPVMRLNSVVLPAPFGPMIAARSPGMILNVTRRTAWRPPKFLDRPRNSRMGAWPPAGVSASTIGLSGSTTERPGLRISPADISLAVLAGRIVATVDRRRQELRPVELAELTDVR